MARLTGKTPITGQFYVNQYHKSWDARIVADNMADLHSIPPEFRYNGMLVLVTDANGDNTGVHKLYQFVLPPGAEPEWENDEDPNYVDPTSLTDSRNIYNDVVNRWEEVSIPKLINGKIDPSLLPTLGLQNLIEDLTPELGGPLDCNTKPVGFTRNDYTVNNSNDLNINLTTGSPKVQITVNSLASGDTLNISFTNPPKPCNIMIKFINIPQYNIAWPAGLVEFVNGEAPTMTSNGKDLVAMYWDGSIYSVVASNNLKIPIL